MNSRIARKVFSKGPKHRSFKKANRVLTKLGGPYRMTINVEDVLKQYGILLTPDGYKLP
jgi:hypothetical protein